MKKVIEKKDSSQTNKVEGKKQRLLYIDILNIVAILAVLILHHNGIAHHYANEVSWYTSLAFECIFYFAVPVFVMISGAMLMNYREKYNTKVFFKKRMTKVLIPAVFWITFVIIWRTLIVKNMVVEDWSFSNVLNMVFSSEAEKTYYFLFLILGVYLTLPVLSCLAKPKYRKALWYLVGAFFVFDALLPNLLSMVGVTYNKNLELMIGGYAMYAVLGYLLSTTEVPKKYRVLLYVLSVVLVVYRYITTVVLSAEAGTIVKTSWGYWQFHAIILASAVFLFVKNMNLKWIEKREKAIKIVSRLAACSFGVYLIHKIVMYYELSLFDLSINSIWWRTLAIFLTYGISVAIVLIIKKIPVLKKVVP